MEIFEVAREGSREFFRNWQDIERSLKISYSACSCVDVLKSPAVVGVEFTVTGFYPIEKLDEDARPFKHVFKVTRHSVIECPTHL